MFARGYGYADTNTGEVVQPDSLFRVASNSKLITAVATMKLIESGLLSLSNSVLSTLGFPRPDYPGATNDPRMASLNVQHLLQHTGGWDRDNAPNPNGGNKFDPVGWSELPARVMGVQGAFSSSNLVEWILGLGLQFQPGSRFAYSNVGYVFLGRIIEAVTGRPYEEYVRSVLRDAGISRMHVSPETLSEWLPGQAVNYDYPTSLSVPYLIQYGVEPRPGDRPMPYSYSTRRTDAAYGWCTSPVDYVRLVNAIDGRPSPADILSAQSVRIMTTPSAVSIGAGEPYGMGLDIDYPNPGDWFHGGSITGTRSKMFRLANGITVMYAVNFNPYLDSTFESFMDTIITGSLGNITTWPTNDFFPTTLSYDAWRTQRFTADELADPAVSGDRADPDGDGSANLFEYASGSHPRDPASHRQPAGSFVTVDGQSYYALTFHRLILGYEVDYVVEASSDLVSWSPLTDPVGMPLLNPDGTQTVTVRDTVPKSASHQRFLRLRISRQEQDR